MSEEKDFLGVTDEEIITDEEYGAEEDDSVQFVTVTTDDGEEITFVEIANLALDGREFTILQPTEPMEDLEDDDVLIFEVVKGENGEDEVVLVEDDATIDAVSEAFYAWQDEQYKDED